MKNNIQIRFHKITKGEDFKDIDFNALHLSNSSMIFISKSCYDNLFIKHHHIEKTGMSENKFLFRNTSNVCPFSTSTKDIPTTDWHLLTQLFFKDIEYHLNGDDITEVLFIYYEGELDEKKCSIFFIITSEFENPINFIMHDFPQFENSMFFLNKDTYQKLKKTTTTISSYKGFERLNWQSDNDYSGGHIMLNTMSNENLYLIENIKFPSFSNTFLTTGIPDTLYFII